MRRRSRRDPCHFGTVQGWIAPSRSDSSLSGTTRSMSMPTDFPNPWHIGQAPNGLLKEKSRGSGSSYRVPQREHSKFSLNLSDFPSSGNEITAWPSPPRNASSIESASLLSFGSNRENSRSTRTRQDL